MISPFGSATTSHPPSPAIAPFALWWKLADLGSCGAGRCGEGSPPASVDVEGLATSTGAER